MKKKLLASLVSFILVFAVVLNPFSMLSFSAYSITEGWCGSTVQWRYYNGTLTFTGTGSINSYSNAGRPPWEKYQKNISRIVFNEGITYVGECVLCFCENLKTISIPNTISGFGDCLDRSKLEYNIYDNAKYLGNEENPYLVLVRAVNTDITSCEIHPNTKIIHSPPFFTTAFAGCSLLESIDIPDSVVSIGERAFYNCTSLKDVTFGDNVKSIGIAAFQGCKSLKKIILPSELTWLNCTFSDCTSLEEVTMGNKIEGIQSAAFYPCPIKHLYLSSGLKHIERYSFNIATLETVSLNQEGPTFHSVGNCIINTADKKLVLGCKNSVIPCDGSVTTIGEFAFQNSQFESVIIPNGITKIEKGAFFSCPNLKYTCFPNSINEIGDYLLESCKSLNSIYYCGTEEQWNNIHFTDASLSKVARYYHKYDDDCDSTCNICNETRVPAHYMQTYWSKDETNHWHECSSCHLKKDASNHIYDNTCDTTCNVCGCIRTITHTYQSAWSSNSTNHWYECSVCHAKKDSGNHIYDNACDITCNTCGYIRNVGPHIYDNACDTTCNECGYVRTVNPHVYDNACDTTCNICGNVRATTHNYETIWSKNDTKHWHKCSVCGYETDILFHNYTDSCDESCNTCGYIRTAPHDNQTTWSNDETNHWYKCEICSNEYNKEPHVFDNACDTTCNTCGYVRTIKHQYAVTWSKDGTNHWYECIICKHAENI